MRASYGRLVWLLVISMLCGMLAGGFPALQPTSVQAQSNDTSTVPSQIQHTTTADWQAGQHDAGYTITQARDGELSLTPQVVELQPWNELVETPLPTTLHDHALLAARNALYLIGGVDDTGIRRTIQRAVIDADGHLSAWETLSPLPAPRSLHSVVQAGNSLLVIGGISDNEPTEVASVIYRAALSGDGHLSNWETVPAPALPSRLEEAASVVVNGSLFVIGGASAEYGVLDTVYRAALRADGTPHTWETQQPLPIPLQDHAVAAQGDCLFVVGGSSDGKASNRVYSTTVDPIAGISTWHELTNSRLPMQRKSHTASIIGSSLVVIGGHNDLPESDGVTVYRAAINADCTLDPWTAWAEQSLPRQMVNHATVVADAFLFVTGGHRYGHSEVYESIYQAALVPERHPAGWQSSTTAEQRLPVGLSEHAATISGDTLLVTGGRSNGSPQAQVYATSALTDGLPAAWHTAPALPRPLYEHVTVATGSRFWTIGGNDGQSDQRMVYTAELHADGTLSDWAAHSCALPQSLSSLAAVVFHDAIYLSGGRNGYEEQTPIHRLQAAQADTGSCWQMVGRLPLPLAEHAMAVANGFLFVSGGITNAGGYLLDTVYAAPIQADGTLGTWRTLNGTPLPMKLSSHSMLTINDTLYLVGGLDGGLPSARHEIFRATVHADGTLDAWQEMDSASLPQSRYNHAAVATDLYLGIIGGHYNAQDMADVLVTPLYVAAPQASGISQIDLGSTQNIGELTWNARGAPDVALSVRYRIADEPGIYGPWSAAVPDGHIAIYDRGRFVQYLVHVSNPSGGVHALDALHLTYGDVGDFVRVVEEDGANVAGVVIYLNGEPLGRTNAQGVLTPDHFTARPSRTDHLAVLSLVDERSTVREAHQNEPDDTTNWSSRTYLTNLDFSPTGAISVTAAQPGGQIVQVSRDHPLILFNLVISIEWDANEAYLEQIARAVRSAADYLFDVTDGQMAFERVAIYDNAAHWFDADIQISTKNVVRPHAYVGGITADDAAQVIRVGRQWDGNTGSSGDWDEPEGYRTLVHEFGHYALYLYDSYFMLAETNGILNPLPGSCISPSPDGRDKAVWGNDATNASIMDYQYHSSELADRRVPEMWGSFCERTEQWRMHQESDWETVQRFYGDTQTPPRWLLRTPQERGAVMAGPDQFPSHVLPFPVIDIQNNDQNGLTIDLTVLNPNHQPHPGALVTLVSGEQRQPIDQGLTNGQGHITIYGAQPQDTVRASSINGALGSQVQINDDQPLSLTMASTQEGAGVAGLMERAALTPHTGSSATNSVFFTLRPGSDGSEMYISLHGFESDGTVNAQIMQADNTTPSAPLAYSSTSGTYEGTAALPMGTRGGTGTVQVMGVGASWRGVLLNSTFTLHTIPEHQATDLYALDGNLHLHLPAGALDTEAHAVLAPLNTLPAAPPTGYTAVGSAYSATLSGARTGSDAPGVLTFRYDQHVVESIQIDPASLNIYRWSPGSDGSMERGEWEQMESTPLPDDRSVSATTHHFGIYALMGMRSPRTFYLPLVMR